MVRQDAGVNVPASSLPFSAGQREQRSGAREVTVVAALLAGAVLLALGSSMTAVAAVLVLAVLLLLARRSGCDAAMDAVVMTTLLYSAVAIELFGLWPLPGVVAVLAACWLASRSGRGALWRSWFRCGRVTRELPWLMMATIAVTAAALVAWQRLFDGRLPPEYVKAAAGRPFWLLVLGGAAFSLVNAAVEEAIFRGVLQTALERVSGPVIAVVVQAVAFGLLHVVGVPTGLTGAIMAGTWGLLLGVMRWRTRGVLAPYLAHIAADVTIFCMLLPTLR